jgi:anaerobic magnesium-protoporphyrin IX monomethyl ester cyclase
MRALLIVPTYQYEVAYQHYFCMTQFPTGLAYLAASLKRAGHEVFGANPNNDSSFRSSFHLMHAKLSKAIFDCDPELIAIGGLCTDYNFLNDAMRLIRKKAPHTPVVMGGGIITNDAPVVFQLLRPDFCIVGEGEEAIVSLAAGLEHGGERYKSIANLGYWDDGVPIFTERNNHYCNINSLPFPDYSPFDINEILDMHSHEAHYYNRYTKQNPRTMVLITARSCPFRCTFCMHTHVTPYRARSMDNVFAEIKQSYELYNFNVLAIYDELFTVNKNRLNEFCERMIDLRAKGYDFDWAFQTHAQANLDRESLLKAKQAGCYYFSYGIESASPAVLKSMNKKTSPEQIRNAIRLSEEVEIGFGGNFIFGDPAETVDTVNESIKFMLDYCLNVHVNVDEVKPYPGSEIFELCVRKGLIKSRLNFYENAYQGSYNMTGMPDNEWQKTLHRIYRLVETDFQFAQKGKILHINRHLSAEAVERNRADKRAIYTVWAICPHCQREFGISDIVDEIKAAIKPVTLVTGCTRCHRRVRLVVSSVQSAPDSEQVFRSIQQCDASSVNNEAVSGIARIGCSELWTTEREFSLELLHEFDQGIMAYPSSYEGAIWGWLSIFLSHIRAQVPQGQGLTLLDIGCRQGWTTWLANSFGKCEGLDASKQLIELAGHNFPDIKFHVGIPAEFAEIHENAYDVLICSDFERMADGNRHGLAKILAKLIRPWGYLLLVIPNRKENVLSYFSNVGFIAVNRKAIYDDDSDNDGSMGITGKMNGNSFALRQICVLRHDPTSVQPVDISHLDFELADIDLIMDTDLVDSCFSLASAARQRGDEKDAIQIARLALDRIPQNLWTEIPMAPLTYLAGSVEKSAGNIDAALSLFSRLVSEGSKMPEAILAGAHYHLASIYESISCYSDARFHAAQCLTLTPDHKAASALKGRLPDFA